MVVVVAAFILFFSPQVPLDDVLSPKFIANDQAPPPSKRGRLSAALKGLISVPSHPNILPLAPNWKLGKVWVLDMYGHDEINF